MYICIYVYTGQMRWDAAPPRHFRLITQTGPIIFEVLIEDLSVRWGAASGYYMYFYACYVCIVLTQQSYVLGRWGNMLRLIFLSMYIHTNIWYACMMFMLQNHLMNKTSLVLGGCSETLRQIILHKYIYTNIWYV